MNTEDQAFDAVRTAATAILGASAPQILATTTVCSLSIPSDDIDGFAQIVSDCLALLPNSEAEVACILRTENGRKPRDRRAMTVGEFARRISRLPDFEG